MRKAAALMLFAVALAGCGGPPDPASRPSRQPVSVRGWIADVAGAGSSATIRTVETEAARRLQMFQNTSVWVENAAYVSGGVAENGAFILLDVPPGNVTISFNAPGAETARLVLQNVPGNADVFVPGLLLAKGSSSVENPKAIRVRLPAAVEETTPTKMTAVVAGNTVPVLQAPLKALVDRRDYPEPPAGYRPLARVR